MDDLQAGPIDQLVPVGVSKCPALVLRRLPQLQPVGCPFSEGNSSHVTNLWASPGGGEQPELAKTVLFDRKLLYSAVLMFVNNYCKIMYILKIAAEASAPW